MFIGCATQKIQEIQEVSIATPGASYDELVLESKDPQKVAEAQERAKERDKRIIERTYVVPETGPIIVRKDGETVRSILNVTGSRELAVACQVADGATTYYALTHGAVELNPILAGLGPWGIVALKAFLAYALWVYHEEIGKPTTTFINVLTCGVAVHNYGVIKGLR